MAITAAHLTQGTNTTASHTSSTTASVTPTANRLVLLSYFSRATHSGDPTVAGCGLTWVLVETTLDLSGTWPVWVFRAMGAAPTAGAITVTHAGAVASSSSIWAVTEFDGVDTSGANGSGAVVQAKDFRTTSSTNPVTITYTGAFGSATNGGYAAFSTGSGAATATPRTGWTELQDTAVAGTAALETQWRATSDTAADATLNSTGLTVVGVAVELKEATAGGSTQLPRSMHQYRMRAS